MKTPTHWMSMTRPLSPRLALLPLLLSLGLTGCSAYDMSRISELAFSKPQLSKHHIPAPEPQPPAETPALVMDAPELPPPAPLPKQDVYTVVVDNVPVKDLLFGLARDAKINLDIAPDVEGKVTLNAIRQTLPQILDRINKQLPLRYQLDNQTLLIENDQAVWRSYNVGYLNMARESTSQVGVATEIATTGGSVGGSGGGGGSAGNTSKTTVTNTVSNQFWTVLENNIRTMLGLAAATGGAATAAASSSDGKSNNPAVMVNPIGGVISVYTTDSKHKEIQAYIDQVVDNAMRQVLIEMTIVEVELNDRYQAGVDWQSLAGGNGLSLISSVIGGNLSTPPVFGAQFDRLTATGREFSATLKLLSTFGNVKVLSSPKIIALNNQTALLKVVDENVYFTVEMEIQQAQQGVPERRTYTSNLHTVPVGLIMSVTPQINEVDSIALNIRPTISRITSYTADPGPKLAGANFESLVPNIQVREMESLLQVANGQTVVMGGLMQNKVDQDNQGIPVLAKLPGIGQLFRYTDDQHNKSELVIFIKPTVIKGGGSNININQYSELLPNTDTTSNNTAQTTETEPQQTAAAPSGETGL